MQRIFKFHQKCSRGNAVKKNFASPKRVLETPYVSGVSKTIRFGLVVLCCGDWMFDF